MEMQQAGRQVYLATLGAAGMVANGGKAVAEMAWAEARRLTPDVALPEVPAVIKGARKPVLDAIHTVEDAVEGTTKTVLGKLGVPTRAEVTTLTRRVEQLIRKVDAMQPVRARATRKVVTRTTTTTTRKATKATKATKGTRRGR